MKKYFTLCSMAAIGVVTQIENRTALKTFSTSYCFNWTFWLFANDALFLAFVNKYRIHGCQKRPVSTQQLASVFLEKDHDRKETF